MSDLKTATERLENAQMAVADAAREVSDMAYLESTSDREYKVPRGEMKALRDALKEWRDAGEGLSRAIMGMKAG